MEDEAATATASDQYLHTFSDAVADMLSHLREPRSAVLEGIVAIAHRTVEREVYPGSGYVLASPVTAIYMALTSGSYRQAIVDTINLGGDTDAMGAMVGAITGAAYGKAAIPAEWYACLHARGRFDDRIDALLSHASDWSPGESLVTLEGEWTALLDRP